MKVVIRKSDLERDTFHCGGHEGQNINKVETGVRYTHKPTGLMASSCMHRTQRQNDREAIESLLDVIRELYKRHEQKHDAALAQT